ncbi:MAG: PE-PGRS family protein [Lysobacterales bacterium]|nr:MAG: PE-PGRS family protein [Xanthomonadales bacterium]
MGGQGRGSPGRGGQSRCKGRCRQGCCRQDRAGRGGHGRVPGDGGKGRSSIPCAAAIRPSAGRRFRA